jgi:hypothetical protein
MIVTNSDGRLLLIRQVDHAELAGNLAENWGNTVFRDLEPAGPLILAAHQHDNGWREWDEMPQVNPATHHPYQFFDMPPAEHLPFYARGVERVAGQDRYAGLLVNMHLVGLYKQRYGIDPDLRAKPQPPLVQAFIDENLARLEEDQRRLRADLQADSAGGQSPFDRQLWKNYKLLQVFDRLSLYLCMPPRIARTLGPAPVDDMGQEVELTLTPWSAGALTVSPYPFRQAPLAVGVTARTVAARDYASDEEFREVYAQVTPTRIEIELRAPA